MRGLIRRLPWKVEFVIVLGLAFGWTLPGTLRSLVTSAAMARSATPPVTDIAVWSTILLELTCFALLAPFLRARGWTLGRLGIRPSLRGCLHGGVLALVAYGLYVGSAVLVSSVWPEVARALAQTRIVGEGVSWTTIVAGSVINPFYEEIFVCGYVIAVLTEGHAKAIVAPARALAEGEIEAMGMESMTAAPGVAAQAVSLTAAVNISAAIRLSYHLYQGAAGVLSIVPIGLLFGYWFVRTRQLWPLIVAHAILDLVGLAAGAG
jgi:membrane protease YdiL (CAAX protease family)